MRLDARIHLLLLPTLEGGRKDPIPTGIYHGIIMFDKSQGFDFRAYVEDPFSPGTARELDIAFLLPDKVSPLLPVGSSFTVWAGRVIGRGHVLRSYL